MKPNLFIKNLKEYPLVSHKAWEYKNKDEVLKLDWNEPNLIVPNIVKNKLINLIKKGKFSWYPDIANKELLQKISEYKNVPQKYIQYFNGCDSALDYIVRTFISPGDKVGLISPTYDNFRVYIESVGAKPYYIFSKYIFSTNLKAILKTSNLNLKAIYLVNPNNPTGVLYTKNEIEKIVKKLSKTLIIIDEAYGEFSKTTVTDLVKKYKNIIVAKSFSKSFGLASFRLGYIISSPENINHINKIRNGKNISTLAQVAGIEVLNNKKYMLDYVNEVIKSRKMAVKELNKLKIETIETNACFILIKVNNPDKFQKKLRDRKVFIRSLSHLPQMNEYLRITICDIKTTKRFIKIVKQIIKND